MWFCGLYHGSFNVLKSSRALCPRFSVWFSILIAPLGGEEAVFVLLVHLFVCFARVCFCPFSLPLGVEGWLRFVIVAYPGPVYCTYLYEALRTSQLRFFFFFFFFFFFQ